jgi:hypothetical protein
VSDYRLLGASSFFFFLNEKQQKSYIPQSFFGGCIQILSKINIRNFKKTYYNISCKSTFFPFDPFSLNFPFWMRLGVRYHCYYLYSVVCQQIWRNVFPLFFPRYTGVKKTSSNHKTLPSIKTIGTCKFSNPKTWPNVKLDNNYHIPDLVHTIVITFIR